MKEIKCYRCSFIWKVDMPLGRSEICPSCREDCKVCLNCLHYDENAYRSCREEQASWVKDKEKNNFCDYFTVNLDVGGDNSEKTKSLNQLDQLFSKGGLKDTPASSTNSLSKDLEDFLNSKKGK